MIPDISVVIPARNEEKTVGLVVARALTSSEVKEVIVVDNNSTDETANIARSRGARVEFCSDIGLGHAMKTGIRSATGKYIFKTDADIDNWSSNWISLLKPTKQIKLKRGIYTSPYNQLPVTKLVVKPTLKIYKPEWSKIPMPITGTYMWEKKSINFESLSNDWSYDISLLLEALEANVKFENVPIGVLSDKKRPISHYEPMAFEILKYLIKKFTTIK